jgi:hypothetical protein
MPTGAANAPPSDPAAGPASGAALGRQRPPDATLASMTPAGSGRHLVPLVLLVLVTFMVGYLGQGFWRIGARAGPPSISAIATDASGGVGSREPVRVRVTIAVVNDGSDQIQVVGAAAASPDVTVFGLVPDGLAVPAGQVGQLTADVAVHCERATPLAFPALQVELIDGVQRALEVGGSGKLLEACARAVATVRPLAVSAAPTKSGSASTPGANSATRRLGLLLSSPTGRPADVVAIRAGGVNLLATPLPVSVAGTEPITVRLIPPRSCPEQWQVSGLPSVLVFDLGPDSASGSVVSLQLKLGSPLTSWLLSTSCAVPR